MEPPVVLVVSRCLLGERVRYDGGEKRLEWLLAAPRESVRVVPVCPETEAGLGVPREPIELRGPRDGRRLVGLVTGRDVTARIREAMAARGAALADDPPEAFVLKSRSPSCGVGSALADGRRDADGLFAAWAADRWPHCPPVDAFEGWLATHARALASVV
jgi:uncharacterized protein YbbK (DUF523 family)